MGREPQDKILLPLNGRPIIRYSIDAFDASKQIDTFVVVYRNAEQRDAIEPLFSLLSQTILWAPGGETRQDSVNSGLQTLPDTTEIVLIHDCARPLVTPKSIQASIDAARKTGVACHAHPVTDTIKIIAEKNKRYFPRSLERSKLWAMETPQSFQYPLIRDAYNKVIAENRLITDDLSAIENQEIPVAFISNGRPNPKLTTPQDIAYIEFLVERFSP